MDGLSDYNFPLWVAHDEKPLAFTGSFDINEPDEFWGFLFCRSGRTGFCPNEGRRQKIFNPLSGESAYENKSHWVILRGG